MDNRQRGDERGRAKGDRRRIAGRPRQELHPGPGPPSVPREWPRHGLPARRNRQCDSGVRRCAGRDRGRHIRRRGRYHGSHRLQVRNRYEGPHFRSIRSLRRSSGTSARRAGVGADRHRGSQPFGPPDDKVRRFEGWRRSSGCWVAFGDTLGGRLGRSTWYRVASRAVQAAAPCVFPEGLLFRRPPGIAGRPGTARADHSCRLRPERHRGYGMGEDGDKARPDQRPHLLRCAIAALAMIVWP